MSDTYDLILAAYPALEPAQKDFDELVRLVKEKKVKIGRRHPGPSGRGRRGPRHRHRRPPGAQGGRLGRRRGRPAVGLAAPPLLGCGRRRRRRRRHRRQVRQAEGRQRPRGGHGREAQARHGRHHRHGGARRPLRRRAGLLGTPAKSVAPMDKKRRTRSQGRARRGGRQVQPRPHACCRSPTGSSAAPPGARSTSRPPTGRSSPGPRRPRTRPTCSSSSSTTPASAVPTPSAAASRRRTSPACRRWGSPTTASTSLPSAPRPAPRCSPDATTTASAWAASPSFPGRSPATPARGRAAAPPCRASCKENGYITGGFGKWHMTPGREMGAAGPFDHWPTGWGFDHWWGFLTGAAGQYDPIITQDNSTLGVPEGEDGKLYYFPDDITDKAVEWLHAVRAQDADKPWFLYYSTGCSPRAAPRRQGVGRQVQGPVRRRLGQVPREDPRAPEEARHRPARHRADRAPRPVPRVGLTQRGPEEAVRPPDGGLRRLLRERRLERRAPARLHRGDGRPRQHARHLHLGRQRRQHGGHPHRLVQRDDLLQRRRPRGRRADGDHREVRRRRGAGRLPHRAALRGGLGVGEQRAVPVGQADGQPSGRRRATQWSSRGRAASSPTTRCATSSRTASTSCPTILELAGIPEPTVVDGIAQEPMDGTSFAYTLDDAEAPPSSTPSSTSRCTAAAPSTRTAGGPAPSSTSSPGTSAPRR